MDVEGSMICGARSIVLKQKRVTAVNILQYKDINRVSILTRLINCQLNLPTPIAITSLAGNERESFGMSVSSRSLGGADQAMATVVDVMMFQVILPCSLLWHWASTTELIEELRID